jgi:hypothetical protein
MIISSFIGACTGGSAGFLAVEDAIDTRSGAPVEIDGFDAICA